MADFLRVLFKNDETKLEVSMIRKATLVSLLIAFALSVSFIGIASAKNATVTGAIEKVNLKTKTLVLKDDQGSDSKTFNLTSQTEYKINGKSVTQINLKTGDKVQIEVNSKNTVLTLDVKSS